MSFINRPTNKTFSITPKKKKKKPSKAREYPQPDYENKMAQGKKKQRLLTYYRGLAILGAPSEGFPRIQWDLNTSPGLPRRPRGFWHPKDVLHSLHPVIAVPRAAKSYCSGKWCWLIIDGLVVTKIGLKFCNCGDTRLGRSRGYMGHRFCRREVWGLFLDLAMGTFPIDLVKISGSEILSNSIIVGYQTIKKKKNHGILIIKIW